ncbi:MAG: hypothetical protein KTR16_09280, partial [Acidiferrobacterales bacterium]|nr:hypothetical protein [Acidiferrobacterales bacterium]
VVKQIRELQSTGSVFQTKAKIGNHNAWFISLFGQAFTFADVDGDIDELKLRCSQKYVFFEYLQDKVYRIPHSYGHCHLSVIGAPQTQFNLVQGGADKL